MIAYILILFSGLYLVAIAAMVNVKSGLVASFFYKVMPWILGSLLSMYALVNLGVF